MAESWACQALYINITMTAYIDMFIVSHDTGLPFNW